MQSLSFSDALIILPMLYKIYKDSRLLYNFLIDSAYFVV